MKKSDIAERLDDLFVVEGEMKKDNGEDSWFGALGENSAIAAVFDGTGGLGANRYRNFSGKTGAYIASRVVSGAVCDWYHDRDRSGKLAEDGFAGLPACIKTAYRTAAGQIDERMRVSGSMTRELPTTAAIAMMTLPGGRQEGKAGQSKAGRCLTDLQLFWAGDSRVYLLQPASGLMQLSKDDLEETDAYRNLHHDMPMNNVISSDGQTLFHTAGCTVEGPFIAVSATDGCFGYVRTPMEFEAMLLEALMDSATPQALRRGLSDRISEVAGDDYALFVMAAGFGDYASMKRAFAQRTLELRERYILPLRRARGDFAGMKTQETGPERAAGKGPAEERRPEVRSAEERQAAVDDTEERLWQEYRTGYEKILRDRGRWNYFRDMR